MQKLSSASVHATLEQLPGWKVANDGLEKTYEFADYYQVMAFVNAIAFVAHGENHHPDLGVHYDKVKVRFTTHDAGGITESDCTSARKVEALRASSDR